MFVLPSADIADALHRQGWWFGHRLLPETMCAALLSEAQESQRRGVMKRAGVGRGASHRLSTQMRGDSIHWLDGKTAAQVQYLALLDGLRTELNRELFLGLFEFEAHFAHYPPGAFYGKHRDSFAGAASRVVSVVTYLNPDWPEGADGELLVYAENGEDTLLRVRPESGTAIVFLSEKIPHEVLPATRDRYSIAGWFRVNQSGAGRVDTIG